MRQARVTCQAYNRVAFAQLTLLSRHLLGRPHGDERQAGEHEQRAEGHGDGDEDVLRQPPPQRCRPRQRLPLVGNVLILNLHAVACIGVLGIFSAATSALQCSHQRAQDP